ncbi:MAG: uroporphyrinogen decarboxylase [Rickettsiales bacterium]
MASFDKTPRKNAPLMRALSGASNAVPPIWMMRQAGRYLPEYRRLRARFPSFVEFCLTPDAVADATLQPITRFNLDAAIIFSDILTVPMALGCRVDFVKDAGPSVVMPKNDALTPNFCALDRVYEGITLTRGALDARVPLIGFAGMPWTLLLYMYGTPGEKEFSSARRRAASFPRDAAALINALTDACVTHVKNQIDAGVDVIQLFESWGTLAPLCARAEYCIAPATRIVREIRAYAPDVPVIWFVKGWGTQAAETADVVLPDAVGVDYATPLASVRDKTGLPLQGNLDPYLLFADDETLVRAVRECIAVMKNRPYIFNLGHGILPETEISKVELLLRTLRGESG